jgi:quercetin dioxygenase-like cupin family protein
MTSIEVPPPAPAQPTAVLEVIGDPVGERHHVLAADEDRLVMELWIGPMDEPNIRHVHERSDETFEVIAGRAWFTLESVTRELGPGDAVLIPRGVGHHWQAVGDDWLHARVEFTPACRFDDFLREYEALVHAGRTNGSGLPRLRDFALMQRRHWDSFRVATMPLPVLRVVVAAGVGLAALTRRRLPPMA